MTWDDIVPHRVTRDEKSTPHSDMDEHISTIRQVFERLRRHGLTAKPSKCETGHAELNLFGHRVGDGSIKQHYNKLENILGTIFPPTKKELRSFLGTIGYY